MKNISWLERRFNFGLPNGLLPVIIERLWGALPRAKVLLEGATLEALRFKPNGKWSAQEQIGHLIDLDKVSILRLQEMKQGSRYLSNAVLPLQTDYNEQEAEGILTRFFTSRREFIEALEAFEDNELDTVSIHPRLQVPMRPVDLAFFHAEHDDHHLLQIRNLLTK